MSQKPNDDRPSAEVLPIAATPVKRIEEKVENKDFPDKPQFRGNEVTPSTIENLEIILKGEGYSVRYNTMSKKIEIDFPHQNCTVDNRDNVGLTQVISLAARYGIATGHIPAYIEVIADKHAYNPVADWIRSKLWDGVDRLPAFFATVTTAPAYPLPFKETLMRKWLLSAVAAVLMPTGFRNRGVLTLQGPQSIGKTSWVQSLVSDSKLKAQFVKLDHHLDTGSKDSILGAISHWIIEIGELESSFKMDVARLKGFLTATTDKVRRPYAKVEAEYARRSVFVATVNDARFLVDPTGNSRWWTIPVEKLDYNHTIDMRQLYAQLALSYEAGEEWWLTPDEEAQLAQINAQHATISAVDELIRSYVDPALMGRADNLYVTASGLLRLLGIDNPSNPQSREAGATLRQVLGEPKRVKGAFRWRFPGALDHNGKGFVTPEVAAQNAPKGKWADILRASPPPPAPDPSPQESGHEY